MWGSFIMKFFGGATLIEAWYDPHSIDPNNVFIKQSIQEGIWITEFVKDTPLEVRLYLNSTHNTFHTGSSFTVLEMHPMSSLCAFTSVDITAHQSIRISTHQSTLIHM